ncbi:hypothetical protein [Streptomyces sp. NPDC052496]|uniref:hypothetical protein n=1 Tax=Streptomyces sp. NPDC052496 TaxID=3154951 RepID=UPI0034274506
MASISRRRRRQVSDDARHLAGCPAVRGVGQEASVDTSGPGCGYAAVKAVISCGHGKRAEFEDGGFGDLTSLIARIAGEESGRRP